MAVVGAIFVFSTLMVLIHWARRRGALPRRRSTQMTQISSTDDWTPEPRSEIITLPSGETQLLLVVQPAPLVDKLPLQWEIHNPDPLRICSMTSRRGLKSQHSLAARRGYRW
jgi:hypothetical protein